MRPKRSAKPKLGRLEKIHPGDYWQTPADFQQWLADADNLELLNEAVGLDLIPPDEEPKQSEYQRLDTLDASFPSLVTAQFGPAEASHLGQLITWAATADVTTVIWVAAEFSADHRHALDWLNQITAGQVMFFGVAVELWQIGQTAMAVEFKRVCTPADEDLSALDSDADPDAEAEPPEVEPELEPEPLTELQQENLDFWSGLGERMDRLGGLVKPGAPTTAAAMGFAIARAGFRLNAIIDRDHHSLYTELLLSGADAHAHFYLLAEEREAIAAEIGLPLIWDDAGPHTCVVASTLSKADLANRERWPDYQAWFCDGLERFYEAFFDRIKYLDATTYQRSYRAGSLTDPLSLPTSRRG
ncbi:MAG: DUF4268 domain-containing protein [Nodosilinea sp.]